jgi:acetoin utilization deacetylase AcuC-like enzyme
MEMFEIIASHTDIDIFSKDDQGANIFHIASEFNLERSLLKLFSLDEDNSLIESKDRAGLRPLHRATSRNSIDTAKLLISKGANLVCQTSNGTSPLHIAAQFSSIDVWSLIVEAGNDETITLCDKFGRSPVDVANDNGWIVETNHSSSKKSILRMDENKGRSPGTASTVIVKNQWCSEHYTCPPSETENPSAPPENIKRLSVLIDDSNGILRSSDINSNLQWVEEAKSATMSDILRVHEWSYIRQIQAKCETIGEDPEEESGIDSIDGDTTMSRNTFKAAMHAAGAVCHAVELVVKGDATNAFCPIRPPGHHAGPRGLVKGDAGGPDSHGFCLLNNISIGASYALNVHRETVKRVAIVDFDVHHGNGTEETIRWLTPGNDELEILNSNFFGSLQQPRYKPWLDENDHNNVLFVSVHGYGPREKGLEEMMPQAAFYPGTGRTSLPKVPKPKDGGSVYSSDGDGDDNGSDNGSDEGNDKEENILMKIQRAVEDDDDDDDDDSFGDSDNDSDSENEFGSTRKPKEDKNPSQRLRELKRIFSPPVAVASDPSMKRMPPLILDVGVNLPRGDDASNGNYRHHWRNYFRDEVFTRLMKFKPDLIFISAGFDAHRKDTINSGYIALVEEDFDWVTTNLVRIANSCCNGRIVSALEGGYMTNGEYCSSFAKSAKAHVASLDKGSRTYNEYYQEDSEKEKQLEKDLIDDIERRRIQKLEAAEKREEALRAANAAAFVLEQQIDGNVMENNELNAGNQVRDEEIVTKVEEVVVQNTTEGDESSKKRRRNTSSVDYVALEKELFNKKN